MRQPSTHAQESSHDLILTETLDDSATFVESQYGDVAGTTEKNDNAGDNLGRSPWYRRKIFWLGTGFVIIALILGMLLNIDQKVLDELRIEVTEMGILAPITDTGFNLSSKGRITKVQSFDTAIDFDGLIDIYWENSLIGTFNFPEIRLFPGDDNLLDSSDNFTITDETRFGDFMVHQLNNETFSWTLIGRPTINTFTLSKEDLNFNKTITLAGGGFRNLSILNYQINVTGLTQQITASFINASPVTTKLGTVGYKFLYNSTLIGLAQADNVTVVPGNNTFILKGPISTNLTIDKLNNFISTLTNVKSGSKIALTAIGDFAKPDGINTVSWLQRGIQSLVLQTFITKPPFIS